LIIIIDMIETDLPLATEMLDSELLIVIAEPVAIQNQIRVNARELSILSTIAIASVFFYILYLFTNVF